LVHSSNLHLDEIWAINLKGKKHGMSCG